MSIEMNEIVILVNKKLSEGLSTAQIEKEMKLGKDTLRKRLNRANYKYNSQLKQYELQYNTSVVESVITRREACITQDSNTKKTQSVITQKNTNVTHEKLTFTEDEIKILKMIASNHKKVSSDYNFKGEVASRSVRTYKKVLEDFAKYCKDNNLSQKECLAIALVNFMKL